MTIEEKLDALAECGLKLKEQFSVTDLADSWGREALDEPGWNMPLICLGMTQEEPPWTPHCENLWHFDTECIEGDGSYVSIAKRMTDMAQGALPLSDIQDHVDIDAGKAWLRFNCQGKSVQVDFQVQDDWVDTSLFRHFVDLLAKCDPDKLFIYFDLGGQDCIIGCVTRDGYRRLQKLIPAVQPLT